MTAPKVALVTGGVAGIGRAVVNFCDIDHEFF